MKSSSSSTLWVRLQQLLAAQDLIRFTSLGFRTRDLWFFIPKVSEESDTKMEEYPEELRTPPVTLISMVGCPELHALISTHLLSGNPPINTLALPDLSKICLFYKKKDSDFNATTSPPSSVGGILKRDWLLKHRTKIPSVLAALFPAQHVFGDPAQWLQVCSDLDSIRHEFLFARILPAALSTFSFLPRHFLFPENLESFV